jgi:hypothetical protein
MSIGVSRNFHIYFSVSRLKKFGKHCATDLTILITNLNMSIDKSGINNICSFQCATVIIREGGYRGFFIASCSCGFFLLHSL